MNKKLFTVLEMRVLFTPTFAICICKHIHTNKLKALTLIPRTMTESTINQSTYSVLPMLILDKHRLSKILDKYSYVCCVGRRFNFLCKKQL